MELALCDHIRLAGLLFCRESAYVDFLAVNHYARSPLQSIAGLRHTLKPSCVVAAKNPAVLVVDPTCYGPQVAPAVIGPITVDVIYIFIRELACHVQDCEPMSAVLGAIKVDVDVAKLLL